MSKTEHLFSDFKKVDSEEWKQQIIKDLKGQDYEKTLVNATYEGIDIQPYYTSSNSSTNLVISKGNNPKDNSWEICQHIDVIDARFANKKALKALNNGITSLQFDFKGEATLKDLLEDILVQYITVGFDCDKHADWLLSEYSKVITERKLESNLIKGSVNYRPLGRLLTVGNWYDSEREDFDRAAKLITDSKSLPFFKTIGVDGVAFQNAGANAVQEIAFTLSQANEYLVQLTDRNLSVDDISSNLQFNLGVGSNYFMEIAKIRAIRILWSKIVEQYKPKNESCKEMYINSETSNFNKSIYDPYVNLLRATTEAMSATLGGCNSLSINTFDSNFKDSDEFSERIAKNIQLVIQEEAYFNKVIDPAAGTYYIESLTQQLCEKAWILFKETEYKGGYLACLKAGFLQSKIKNTAEQKIKDVESGKLVFLGVNKYPNANEKMSSKLTKNLTKKESQNTIFEPLITYRALEKLEAERLQKEI